jgi:hypothetical protein
MDTPLTVGHPLPRPPTTTKPQGKFKKEVDASVLCMGQEFVKYGVVPAWLSELVLTATSKAFSSSAHVDVYARLPYFMNPIMAACQVSGGGRGASRWALGCKT